MFRKFRNNLVRAKALIVIGYGGKDEGINDYLLNFFDYQNKPCFFIDPGIRRNAQLLTLANSMKATKIEKSIGDFDGNAIRFKRKEGHEKRVYQKREVHILRENKSRSDILR